MGHYRLWEVDIMTAKRCPSCNFEVSGVLSRCPYCGEVMNAQPLGQATMTPPAMPGQGPPPLPPPPRFRFAWWLLLACLPGALLTTLVERISPAEDATWPAGVAFGLGVFAFLVLLAYLIARLTFALSRRNQPLASVVALVVVLLLSLIPPLSQLGNAIQQRAEEQAALAELEQEIARTLHALAVEQQAALTTGDLLSQSEATRRLAMVYVNGADRLGKDQRVAFHALGQMLMGLADAWQDYDNGLERIIEAGAIEPTTLRSRDDIDQRLTLYRQLADANIAIRHHAESLPQHLERHFNEANADPRAVEIIQREFLRGFNQRLPDNTRMRELDEAILNNCIQVLNLYRQEWGTWEVDPITGIPYFETDETVTQFNQLATQLDTLIAEQDQLALRIAQQMLDLANTVQTP